MKAYSKGLRIRVAIVAMVTQPNPQHHRQHRLAVQPENRNSLRAELANRMDVPAL